MIYIQKYRERKKIIGIRVKKRFFFDVFISEITVFARLTISCRSAVPVAGLDKLRIVGTVVLDSPVLEIAAADTADMLPCFDRHHSHQMLVLHLVQAKTGENEI